MSPREMNADHLWSLTIPVSPTDPKLTPKVTPTERTPSRFLDTLGSESPRIPQQNAPLDTTGRGRNGGNRPSNQGVAGSDPSAANQ